MFFKFIDDSHHESYLSQLLMWSEINNQLENVENV